MPLKYGQPNEVLQRELRQVASEAEATLFTLREANHLPDEFPTDNLENLCKSLMGLQNGTAENCRPVLEYARTQIPAIRRENFCHDDPRLENDSNSSLTRGLGIDSKLSTLLLAVGTALDEYRAQAQDRYDDRVKAEPVETISPQEAASIASNADFVIATTEQAQRELLRRELEKTAEGDILKRRLSDGQNLSIAGRSLLSGNTVRLRSLQAITQALKELPQLIGKAGKAIQGMADLGDDFAQWWSTTEHKIIFAVNDQVRGFGNLLEKLAKRFERNTNAAEGQKSKTAKIGPGQSNRNDTDKQFASDLVHEMTDPLSSLRSAVDSMRLIKTDDQRNRLLEVIEHDVRRLDRLASDTFAAVRLDGGLIEEKENAFDLAKMIATTTKNLGEDAEAQGVELIVDLPDVPNVIMGLEARLAQVLVNLISNALSFCEEGDAIRVWMRRRENRTPIVVEDTGPGIDEAALTKVFDRFYCHRPEGQFGEHLGLGLSIAKQIVEAHGGVIWSENVRTPGADMTSNPLGARFVVGLPV